MWLSSLFQKKRRPVPGGRSHRPAGKRPTFRPRLDALEDRLLPSTLTVTSLADSGPGTLRAAIQTADAGSQSDNFTIKFAVTGTIDLQSGLPSLTSNIDIKGPGESSLTVERAAGASFIPGGGGFFFVLPPTKAGVAVTVSDLTLANSDNGAVANFGAGATLTLANCALVNNSIAGGVNVNFGTMTISDCTFSGNSATTAGGGIYNAGKMTITDSMLSGNTALFSAYGSTPSGGGIYNAGQMTITDSMLSGNTATLGGGIANGVLGTLTLSGSTLTGNSATYGGGIYNLNATLTVADNSTITLNSATYGGGIYNDFSSSLLGSSSVTVSDSVLTANSATRGAGIYNNASTTLDVKGSSTLSGNTASDSGGGIYNLGTATVEGGSTLSGNTAGTAGGGIYNGASGTLTVKNSTVFNNTAPSGADIYDLGTMTLTGGTIGVIGP